MEIKIPKDQNGQELKIGDLIERINFNGSQYKDIYQIVKDDISSDGYAYEMVVGNDKAMRNRSLCMLSENNGKLIKGRKIVF